MPYPLRKIILAFGGIIFPALWIGAKLAGKKRLSRAAFLAFHALLLYPTLKRNCSAFGPVITSFRTRSKSVWLTLDDGPDPQTTSEILDLLKAHNATASFFCIGEKVERHPDLCQRMLKEGHTIENHTQTHPVASFWANTPSQIRREVGMASDSIRSVTGILPRFFRSPVGMTNPFVHPVLEEQNLRLIGWNCAGFDGACRSPRAVLKCLLPDVKPGSIILLHEGTSHPSSRIATLRLLLQYLTMRGYSCVIPPMESLIS